jgi:adenosylhomocysteine nucleosidase
MIGIIGAMEVEVNAIIDMLENKKEKVIGPITFTLGTINGKDVVVAKCGIGKVFAAMCAESMIQNFELEYLLNVGVGGSLSKNLNVASIAISKSCVQHDMDTSPLGDPVGMISGINIIEIPASKAVIWKVEEAVKSLGIDYEIGVIASGDQFVNSSEKKDYISKTFNAIACEMEGAAIAQVAYVNKVPFCVIRAISDSADGSSHTEFFEFLKIAVDNSKHVIAKLIQ